MAKRTIAFSIYLDGKLIDHIEVDRPVFNIGKLSTSTVRLDDVNVSRKHAVVERRDDGAWRITDLGSTNGTLLRGERIEQAELRDGDRLLIGRTTLVAHIASVATDAAPAFAAPAAIAGSVAPRAPRVDVLPPPPAPSPRRARGYRLPAGSVGHLLTLCGAILFCVGSVFLPWQRFELAQLDITATQLSWLGLLVTAIGTSTFASSAWGLITGRRHAAARFNLVASLVVGVWLVLAASHVAADQHLMRGESVSIQTGFLVACAGFLLMLGGTGTVFASLPRWDASTTFLRLLVSRGERPIHDVIVYEPGIVDLAARLDATGLPRFEVTREGDTLMKLAGRSARIPHGDRGTVEVEGTRVHFLFVKPLSGRGQVRLTTWSEGAAFGLLTVLFALSLGLYSILGWDVDAHRTLAPADRRATEIELVITEDQAPEDRPRTLQIDLPEPELATPEAALTDDERLGDETSEALAPGDEEALEEATHELVDLLNPRVSDAIDLTQLSPTERQERARARAQQTAMAQAFQEDNPLYAQLMTANPDVDTRVNVLGALDRQGTFIAGAVDPFGGTLSGTRGFPGGGDDGGIGGGPHAGGPAVAGLERAGGDRDLDEVRFKPLTSGSTTFVPMPHVRGTLEPTLVLMYIRRYLPGIKWCYQDRLQAERKLAGRLTLAFTIMPQGNVLDARVTNSTLADAPLEQCITSKMARWKFPTPEDGGVVEVGYQLILKTP